MLGVSPFNTPRLVNALALKFNVSPSNSEPPSGVKQGCFINLCYNLPVGWYLMIINHLTASASRNTVPLVFAILPGATVVWWFKPLNSVLGRISKTAFAPANWPATLLAISLSLGMVLFQLLIFK
jgi:hypothetical protein